MRIAIALLELKEIPTSWTKEEIASALETMMNAYGLKGNYAAIKIFEVSE